MKPKKLLPLIIILVVLAGLVFLRKQGAEAPSIVQEANLRTLIPDALKVDDIGRIELYAGASLDEKVVLTREDDGWRVTSHFGAPVKGDTIDGFLGKLVKMKGEFRAKADTETAQETYQLKGDQAFHVQAFKKGSDTAEVDLLLGKAPSSTSVFMCKAGEDDVYVEGTNLRRDAGVFSDDVTSAPTASHWLNKDILKLTEDSITKVTLNMPDKSLTFEKRVVEKEPAEEPVDDAGDDATVLVDAAPPVVPDPIEYEWVLASGGAGVPHTESRLTSLISSLANFNATDVVDPALNADWGLAPPAFAGTISIDGEEDVVIEGGRPERSGDGYIRLANAAHETVYKVSSFTFERLFPKGSDMFMLPTLGVTASDITHIEIEQPEGNIVLDKASGDWKVVAPPVNLTVQDTAISTLVSTLGNWTPNDYADEATLAGDFARMLRVTAGDRTRTISVGGDAASVKGSYAKVDGEALLLAMGESDITKLFLKARDVYALTLLDIEESGVAKVEAKYSGGEFSLDANAGDWTLNAGDGTHVADSFKSSDLVSTLAALQAKSFRFDVFEATWTPYLALDMTLNDGTSYKFNVGPEKNGVHLLSLSGQSNLFELAKSDVDEIIAQLDGVSAPEPEPETESAVE